MNIITAGNLRAVVLEVDDLEGPPEQNWLEAVSAHEPVAVIVRRVISQEAIDGVRKTADSKDAPAHDVYGMRCTGSPLRLSDAGEDPAAAAGRYFERALQLREELRRHTTGPVIENVVASVLGRLAGAAPLNAAVNSDSGHAYLGAAIVTMYEGQYLPYHCDQRFFSEPTIFSQQVNALGFNRIVNYVVPIELPKQGGVIEMTDLRWDLLGDDPSRALNEMEHRGELEQHPHLPFPLEVGDMVVLDAMMHAHRVSPVAGSRRITYTGSIGFGPRGPEYFV